MRVTYYYGSNRNDRRNETKKENEVNMKVLSVALCAGEMRISVLDGSMGNPILLEKNVLL